MCGGTFDVRRQETPVSCLLMWFSNEIFSEKRGSASGWEGCSMWFWWWSAGDLPPRQSDLDLEHFGGKNGVASFLGRPRKWALRFWRGSADIPGPLLATDSFEWAPGPKCGYVSAGHPASAFDWPGICDLCWCHTLRPVGSSCPLGRWYA